MIADSGQSEKANTGIARHTLDAGFGLPPNQKKYKGTRITSWPNCAA
jgi:hypothetical protein